LALELDFWRNHVAIGVPPAPETSDDASAIWPTTKPGEIMADERGHLAAEALYSVRARLKELEAEKDALETELKKQLADQGEVLVYKGKKIASWKQATRTSIDTKALAADNPDLAKQYERVRPYRSFRFSYKP
jgi:predicted phage-related endonuclease